MGLELYRIGPGVGDRVDKRVCQPETTIVRLCNLANNEAPTWI
jgi:hypothetical protein